MLLIAKVKVLVIGVAVVQELHKFPPLNLAATTSKSLEVHEVVAGGKDCAKDIDKLNKQNIRRAKIFFEIVIFGFIKLNLIYGYIFV